MKSFSWIFVWPPELLFVCMFVYAGRCHLSPFSVCVITAVLWGFITLMWLFFSTYSLRFIVSWWMALADNVLWTYPWHLPRRPSCGAAGQQETTSSLSKHHGESKLLVFWSTQGAGEEKPHPTWSLSPPTHVVRDPWPTTVQARTYYLWSIHRCLSPARNCPQPEVLSCLTLPSALLPSEESPGRGLGGNCQSQDLPLSAPFCQNVVKQRGSIFHSTQLSIFFGDERTVQLSIPRSRDELLKKSCMAPWHGGHWHDREINMFSLKPLWFAVFLFVSDYLSVIDREYENTSFLTFLSAGVKPFDLW